MNYDLITILSFVIILIILSWIMPNKKVILITKCFATLLHLLPISKIVEAVITYYKQKKI